MLSLIPQPRSTDGYVVHTSTIASTRPQDMKSPQLRSLTPVCILVPRGLNALAQPGQYNVLYNPLLLLCFVHSSDSREGKHFGWLRTTRQAAKCRHALNWLRFDSTSHSFPKSPPLWSRPRLEYIRAYLQTDYCSVHHWSRCRKKPSRVRRIAQIMMTKRW